MRNFTLNLLLIKVRYFLFIYTVLSFISCDYFSFERKKNVQELDTILDRSSVDTFPSFSVCDSIIDKMKKANCFRKTIHREISESLCSEKIAVQKLIDETVEVSIIIFADHRIELKSITASNFLREQIPAIDEKIGKCIRDLPKVHAAIKQGIPVTSIYKLPIRVKWND